MWLSVCLLLLLPSGFVDASIEKNDSQLPEDQILLQERFIDINLEAIRNISKDENVQTVLKGMRLTAKAVSMVFPDPTVKAFAAGLSTVIDKALEEPDHTKEILQKVNEISEQLSKMEEILRNSFDELECGSARREYFVQHHNEAVRIQHLFANIFNAEDKAIETWWATCTNTKYATDLALLADTISRNDSYAFACLRVKHYSYKTLAEIKSIIASDVFYTALNMAVCHKRMVGSDKPAIQNPLKAIEKSLKRLDELQFSNSHDGIEYHLQKFAKSAPESITAEEAADAVESILQDYENDRDSYTTVVASAMPPGLYNRFDTDYINSQNLHWTIIGQKFEIIMCRSDMTDPKTIENRNYVDNMTRAGMEEIIQNEELKRHEVFMSPFDIFEQRFKRFPCLKAFPRTPKTQIAVRGNERSSAHLAVQNGDEDPKLRCTVHLIFTF
ncbi:hypothetical protein QR680_003688 [Steinernema hermaphroditum]|uniref:Uncharacterized protein n=1 Tax=Steinernema hermaphroditum TaxID=289476 RepID=A0AA39LSR7_9BILA|nr:hypothetical protein QR680_003688 [Steinernema hermaphroditum]